MRTRWKAATALLLLSILTAPVAADDASEATLTQEAPTGDYDYYQYGDLDEVTFEYTVDSPPGEVKIFLDGTEIYSASKQSGSVSDTYTHSGVSSGDHDWSLRYNADDGSTTFQQESFKKLTYAETALDYSNYIDAPSDGESRSGTDIFLSGGGKAPPGDFEFQIDGSAVYTADHDGDRLYSTTETVSPGEHIFDLYYLGDDGSSTAIDSHNFYADTEPTADFSFSPTSPNTGETVDFDDLSSDPEGDSTIDSWNWDFDDGSTSFSQNPSHSFSSGGLYEVSLTVTDNNGLTDTYTTGINVNSDPTADFSYNPSDPHADEDINFYDDSSDPDGDSYDISWDFGDGSTASGAPVTHSYSSSGTYTVEMTVTDEHGATDTWSETITVDEPNSPPSSDFTYSPSDPLVGESIDFSEQASDSDGSIDSYDWTWDDGSFSTSANPSHTYDSSGTYTVELTVTDNDGATDSYSETITVQENTPPDADFSFSPLQPIEGDEVSFTDESTDSEDNIDSWSWDFGDGFTSTLQNPTNTFTSAGNYTVELTVTDEVGASDTVTRTVEVDTLRPSIESAKFIDNQRTSESKLVFTLDDNGNNNLDSFSGPGSLLEFTNSTLALNTDLPLSGEWLVTSFDGTDSNTWNLDVESSRSPLREDGYSHSLDVQRLNRTYEFDNFGENRLEYNLTMQSYGDPVSDEQVIFNISAGSTESQTGVWEGDWITGEDETSYIKGQNRSETSSLGQQYIFNQTQLSVVNQRNFSFTELDISSICSTTETVDIPSGESTPTQSCNNQSYSGDWISDVEKYAIEDGQNTSAISTIDTQYLANQTGLKANNTLGFDLPVIDISSECEDTSTATISPGYGTVTESCSVDSEQGDWIKNEEVYNTRYDSETVIYGGGIDETYTAVQNIYAENSRVDLDLDINFSEQIEDVTGCSIGGSSVRTIPAVTGKNSSIYKSCDPGREIEYVPVQKTAVDDKTRYNLTTRVQVYSNLTEEQEQWIGIPTDRLDNWADRNAGETEAFVNGRDTDVSVDQGVVNGTEYVFVIVGDEYGNSSLHEGNHTASLLYYEGGGDSSNTGSGSGSTSPGSVIDEVEGEDYSWTLSNPQSGENAGSGILAIPGREFVRTLVVENQGDQPVDLDIQCLSDSDSCRWVSTSVDRIELGAGEGTTQTFQVRGKVPQSATPEETYRFSIRVGDPSYDESTPSTSGAADADYVVNINPVLGGIITGIDKIFSMREIPPPVDGADPIPYPFFLIPLLSGASVFAALEYATDFVGIERNEAAIVDFFVAFAVFIVVTMVA